MDNKMLFSCMDCDNGFNLLWELTSHVSSNHMGEAKNWNCQLCSGSFGSKTFYNIHQTTNHFGKGSLNWTHKGENEMSDQMMNTCEDDMEGQACEVENIECHLLDKNPASNELWSCSICDKTFN